MESFSIPNPLLTTSSFLRGSELLAAFLSPHRHPGDSVKLARPIFCKTLGPCWMLDFSTAPHLPGYTLRSQATVPPALGSYPNRISILPLAPSDSSQGAMDTGPIISDPSALNLPPNPTTASGTLISFLCGRRLNAELTKGCQELRSQ